jgi:hypothetical protein
MRQYPEVYSSNNGSTGMLLQQVITIINATVKKKTVRRQRN